MWGCAVGVGDLLKDASSRGPRSGKAILPERAVGDHRHAMLFAPWDHGVLDRTFVQVIEDLVADAAVSRSDRVELFEIGDVEVAHAPGENFPLMPELLEGRDGFL